MLVFEQASALQRLRSLTPGTIPEQAIDWESWLSLQGEAAPAEYEQRRADFAAALQSAPTQGGDWLATVESLRLIPIRSVEDAEFCFSHLPPTPKNLFLLKLLRLYLDSDLGQMDRVARTLRLMETASPMQEVRFIRAETPSPLFAEMAAAFGAGGDRLMESWAWDPLPSRRRSQGAVILQAADASATLDRLCDKVQQLVGRWGSQPVAVHFHGPDASLCYLQQRLALRGVATGGLGDPGNESLSPTPAPSAAQWKAKVFAWLRQAPLTAIERLQLAARWLQEAHPPATASELHTWLLAQGSYETLAQSLLPHGPTPSDPEAAPGEPLTLLPFHPLPPGTAKATVVYWEPYEAPSDLALDSSERQKLRAAGFAIAEAQPRVERDCERLAAWARRGPRCFMFFSPAPPAGFAASTLATVPAALPNAARQFQPGPPLPPKSRPLSATALETFSLCPTRYLYRENLRLRPRVGAADSHALWFGQLVHASLEKAFKQSAQTPTPCELLRCFDAELQTLAAREPIPAWQRAAMRGQFAPIAQQLPALEAQLREMAPEHKPERFEQDFVFEVPTAYGPVALRGRTDRLDKAPDNPNLLPLVIDYKTGTVGFSPDHVRRGKHFQALVYALGVGGTRGAGVLFYDLKQLEVRRGMLLQGAFPHATERLTRGHVLKEDAWASLLQEGRAHLVAVAEAIQSGECTPTPSAAACEYCEYGVHCRVRTGWTGGEIL